MNNFFRHIRHNLLKNNRFSKYLIYAIGEIILVVVGILIALQINNWNERNKSLEIEHTYLNALNEEFKNNLEGINRVMAYADSSYQGTINLLKFIESEDRDNNEDRNMRQIRRATQFPPKFIPSPGILNDLTNAGYLSKLQNQNLREELDRWFVLTQEIEEEEKELWEHRSDILKYLQLNTSLRKNIINDGMDKVFFDGLDKKFQELSYMDMLQDPYYDNLLLFYGIMLKSLKDEHYPKLRANIEDILKETKR